MGAVPRTLIPRFIAGPAAPRPVTELDDLLARTQSVELKEIRQLLPFVPLIFLIPESSLKSQTVHDKIRDTQSERALSQTPNLFRLLGPATEKLKTLSSESEFAFGEVTVNFPEMAACRKGQPVKLTTTEFKTLKYLIGNPRRVISRDELLDRVWGYQHYPCTRTVDNHILRLRKKLEKDPSRPVHFRTIHGAGYQFLP